MMSSSSPQSLDKSSIQLLESILTITRSTGEGVDAVNYRAQHEEQLDLLDELEQNGYLRKDSEKYWVTLCGLLILDERCTGELLGRCEKLFAVLRNHYKLKPKADMKVADLATSAELTLQDVIECLGYMVEGSWWANRTSDFKNSNNPIIRPSESILKHKTFRELVAKRQRDRSTAYFPKTDLWASESPIDAVASATLLRFDAEHVRETWQKALERRSADPGGAITSARTLLEAVCKYILDEESIEYDDKADLPKLYSLVANQLALAPNQHTEKVFKKILGNCQAVIEGLGEMRDRLSDAHGKGNTTAKPAPRHAELAVNLAGTMATFLISTWEARKKL